MQPVHHNPNVEKPHGISAKFTDMRNFLFLFRLSQDLAHETQILQSQFLRLKTERTELGMRLQGTKKHGPNKIFIRLDIFELPVDDGKELLRQRGPLKPCLLSKPFE